LERERFGERMFHAYTHPDYLSLNKFPVLDFPARCCCGRLYCSNWLTG
jgi:hypothetical protein